MSLRVGIHQGNDGDPGFEAWALDYIGLATYAESRDEVLDRLPSKYEEHLLILELNGLPAERASGGIEVLEEISGNELLFDHDRTAANPAEIETTTRLLEWTRRDLVRTIDDAPDDALDWDPPYRFADWATWRTVRDNLWHIANAETHGYLARIGIKPTMNPAGPDDWRVFLPRGRSHALVALGGLKASPDRARVSETGGRWWSVRKSLRRMVRHEIMHTRSIRRIVRAFEARTD